MLIIKMLKRSNLKNLVELFLDAITRIFSSSQQITDHCKYGGNGVNRCRATQATKLLNKTELFVFFSFFPSFIGTYFPLFDFPVPSTRSDAKCWFYSFRRYIRSGPFRLLKSGPISMNDDSAKKEKKPKSQKKQVCIVSLRFSVFVN